MKDRLVARRKQLRWERKEAAHIIDIDYQYLYKLEKGQNVPPTWGLLVKLANGLQTSVDYILELTNDPTPAAERGEWTPEAIAAARLINTAPPERQAGALAVLKAAVELTQAEMLEPPPAPANVGGGVTLNGQKQEGQQRILNGQQKDELLALLKKMLPQADYEYVARLVEAGEPLTEADINRLLQAPGHKPIQKGLETLNNNNLIGNG